ncbi:uncharacterized protein J3D65DRAFT_69447 [Phyllosticta citribraziliensis]|uniref:Uncharacterized protein n=1 Tax=Phyllosticta citribraziliensis TaxID=989973 RepID=A0ABR1LCX5_9PEZI
MSDRREIVVIARIRSLTNRRPSLRSLVRCAKERGRDEVDDGRFALGLGWVARWTPCMDVRTGEARQTGSSGIIRRCDHLPNCPAAARSLASASVCCSSPLAVPSGEIATLDRPKHAGTRLGAGFFFFLVGLLLTPARLTYMAHIMHTENGSLPVAAAIHGDAEQQDHGKFPIVTAEAAWAEY